MIYRVGILLFDKFETLDVFGPVKILGRLPYIFKLNFVSANGGIVESSQNARIDTNLYTYLYTYENDIEKILLVPGGGGTREKVHDNNFINLIKDISNKSKYTISIYTSSGVSAGIDMALGFIEDLIGKEKALEISQSIEYFWNEDSKYDPFSKIYE